MLYYSNSLYLQPLGYVFHRKYIYSAKLQKISFLRYTITGIVNRLLRFFSNSQGVIPLNKAYGACLFNQWQTT